MRQQPGNHWHLGSTRLALGIGLSLLSGAEEKTSVFVDWGWTAITHKRGKRIIICDDEAEA